ncbi:MAG: helix-turn-helix domain-containing protein [Chthoniobacterales bacterium]|nr:helix-turn-helix domain-containing protein [Chthoniobacterales bacterium]
MIAPDDSTLADRVHLRTLVEHGLAPLLRKQPADILQQILGEPLPSEPVFANLTTVQLARCMAAAERILSAPPAPAPTPPAPTLPAKQARLAYNSDETTKLLGVTRTTLWRLCKRGLIRPSVACRRPLFSAEEIERFLRDTRAS